MKKLVDGDVDALVGNERRKLRKAIEATTTDTKIVDAIMGSVSIAPPQFVGINRKKVTVGSDWEMVKNIEVDTRIIGKNKKLVEEAKGLKTSPKDKFTNTEFITLCDAMKESRWELHNGNIVDYIVPEVQDYISCYGHFQGKIDGKSFLDKLNNLTEVEAVAILLEIKHFFMQNNI